ncbi:MAG TPA: alpha-amylase family glycosyl hydrolase [Agriterribacter sp.]|nr:alpha-amylase family glycosyl hydrolase [Agriterribacter sp.]
MAIKPDNNHPDANAEIIYHVFQRSFFDSDNDGNGDIEGLRQKLDYLQDLGITSILLTPLYKSAYYHNYFADDFERIDPAYGTMDSYFSLVKEIHLRRMKVYMDMEIQYITEDHEWYKASYGNPLSTFSDYLLYKDKENKVPETIIFNIKGLLGYDGVFRNITTVNLHNQKVQDYMFRLFSYWLDPGNNSDFEKGVDGFRLDHMMDNLDNKNRLNNLFSSFWKPLINKLKQVNPAAIFIAEQTDWNSFGKDHIIKGGVDGLFAFPLREAMLAFEKQTIATAAEITFSDAVAGQNIVFIENHDTQRFATHVSGDAGKLRVGAALNLMMAGIPAIYYGQELGMTGEGGFEKYGLSDGNDIPRREAFKWSKDISAEGMALWYKDTGPWWDDSSLILDNGISLEEQEHDPDSLWNFYKKIISLRKSNAAVAHGEYHTLQNNSGNVYSFLRYTSEHHVIVVINLSGRNETVRVDLTSLPFQLSKRRLSTLFGTVKAKLEKNSIQINTMPFGIGVWSI